MEKDIKKFFEKDRFAHYVGIELVKVESGYAVTSLKLEDKHLNGMNSVQGGAIFTLADFAFAAATNSNGLATVGINCSITYFKAPQGKVITAYAKETSAEKKICGCDVEVLDEDGTLVAKFSGTGYRINKTIDFKEGTLKNIASKS
ncbi:PaaI family thioesterase [Ruminiclostridium herbifermentans]|uniref:PaaI family thioesterase n=1 Tax=Ruminiclostridium herbifermentans TaxID=2488810 RepID=A0A4V6EPZ7_9FIRM|nr:PaaI family thioesterase [Ruminiclostridium herbifermentans]QNU65294.1 PaaI family thioesterase [Ruminiclostridium herbifermentans]